MRTNFRSVGHSIALCIAALAIHDAWAGDVIVSTSASADDLHYRLFDLDPNDGITPALSINGVWVAAVTSVSQPEFMPPGDPHNPSNYSEHNISTALSYDGVTPLQGTSSVAAGLPDGTVAIAASGHSVSVHTQLTSNDLLTGTDSGQALSDSFSGINATTGESGTWIKKFQNIYSTASGLRDVIVTGGAPGSDPRPFFGTNPMLNLVLTPHTLLVIEGKSTLSVSADRSNLAQSIPMSSGSADYYAAPVEGHSQSIYVNHAIGQANAQFYARLSDSPGDFTVGQFPNGNLSVASDFAELDYDQTGFHGQAAGTTVTDTAKTVSSSKSWAVQFANVGDTDKTLFFSLSVTGKVYQSLDLSKATLDSSFIPTGVVPEPGTYLLAGLGLVGISFVRRRSMS